MPPSATAKAKPQASGVAAAGRLDARVDTKIANASPALQPVLNHIRGLVHDTLPGLAETVKWGMPFFELDGVVLAYMGIFKQHCAFGFWSKSMKEHLAGKGYEQVEGAGSFGKITTIDDLPPYRTLAALVREAAAQVKKGTWQSPFAARAKAAPRPEMPIPDDFAAALTKSPQAIERFRKFSPGCRREYLVWITEAKREETRARRIAQAVSMIAEGKQRNWQYVK